MKEKLKKWISDFVDISAELSEEVYLSIRLGMVQIIVPDDIYKILETEKVIFKRGSKTFFNHKKSFLEVIPNPDYQITIGIKIKI